MILLIHKIWSLLTRKTTRTGFPANPEEMSDTAFAEQQARADVGNCLPVSRHGLQENGVKCPRCGHQAIPPAGWRLIHRIDKRDKTGPYVEEAVCCWKCNAFLLASPDDDIDPITTGEPYDKNIYHRFVRPKGMSEIIQEPRTLTRPPENGDWVYICGGEHEGGEGRVMSINGASAQVQLAGFQSVTRNNEQTIAMRHMRPMVFDVYHIGMRMRVDLGPYAGREGKITWQKGAEMLLVDDHGAEFGPVIQEHVYRLDLENTPNIDNTPIPKEEPHG